MEVAAGFDHSITLEMIGVEVCQFDLLRPAPRRFGPVRVGNAGGPPLARAPIRTACVAMLDRRTMPVPPVEHDNPWPADRALTIGVLRDDWLRARSPLRPDATVQRLKYRARWLWTADVRRPAGWRGFATGAATSPCWKAFFPRSVFERSSRSRLVFEFRVVPSWSRGTATRRRSTPSYRVREVFMHPTTLSAPS